MGQAAKSNIRIEFKKDFIPVELRTAEALEAALVNFYKEVNPEKQKPDVTVTDLETYDCEVELTLYSTRRQNLDFQVDLIDDYLNSKYSKEIEEINEDTWSQN